MQRLIALTLSVLLLTGCVASRSASRDVMPELRLAPSTLGREIAWQQRLDFVFEGRTDRVDALLEVDAQILRLALHRLGQVALRLQWDGSALQEQRAPGLPESLSATRILFDLQFVYWPLEAVQGGLPTGWSVSEREGVRELRQGGEVVSRVEHADASHAILHQLRLGYRLDVSSQPVLP